jgi:hypothetical protein
MNNTEVLKTLRGTKDLYALKDAVLKICGPRGPAISHEFIFHSEKRSVSCLLEMKYALSDAEMRELGAYGFANMACLEFELASAQHQGLRSSVGVHRAVFPQRVIDVQRHDAQPLRHVACASGSR